MGVHIVAGLMLFGGCLMGDTYHQRLKGDFSLLCYVARQSLISAMSGPTSGLPDPKLGSAFQKRCVDGDIKGDLYTKISRFSADADVFAMDLLVERLGVLKMPDGTYITRSNELIKSSALSPLKPAPPHIREGTPQHQNLFHRAAFHLADSLNGHDLLSRTIVISTPLANVTSTGRPMHKFQRYDVEAISSLLAGYAHTLQELGIEVRRMPPELAVADEDHQWGAAPWHYTAPAYDWISEQVREKAASC